MPVTTVGDRSRVDTLKLCQSLREMKPEVCVLEEPLFFGTNAAGAVGTTGINWGIVYSCLQHEGIPIELVYPSTWTRVIHSLCRKTKLSENPKEKTKECLGIVYPKANYSKDGDIDAIMLGFWYAWTSGLLQKYRTKI